MWQEPDLKLLQGLHGRIQRRPGWKPVNLSTWWQVATPARSERSPSSSPQGVAAGSGSSPNSLGSGPSPQSSSLRGAAGPRTGLRQVSSVPNVEAARAQPPRVGSDSSSTSSSSLRSQHLDLLPGSGTSGDDNEDNV